MQNSQHVKEVKQPSKEEILFGARLVSWELRTQWILGVLALVFLFVFAYEVVGHLTGTRLFWAELINTIIWILFCIDFIVRLSITQNRWKWLKTNILDLLSLALPFLRPLRLLRLLALIRLLQRTTGARIRNQLISYTVASTTLLVVVSSLAILEAERDIPEASITTFSDALWWSVVTITTVGYGDYTPISPLGRIITLGLMIGGMALIGVITATLASWITERASEENERVEVVTREHITQLEQSILALRDEVAALREKHEKNPPA